MFDFKVKAEDYFFYFYPINVFLKLSSFNTSTYRLQGNDAKMPICHRCIFGT